MRPGGGKTKGAAFERKVCEQLSLWISNGKRDDLFWRSAMSGGRATVKQKKGKQNQTQHGDITAIHPLGSRLTRHFFVECKSYKDLQPHQLLWDGNGANTLGGFWEKCKERAIEGHLYPMLIVKQNFFSELVCLSQGGMKFLEVDLEDTAAVFPYRGLYVIGLNTFCAVASLPRG